MDSAPSTQALATSKPHTRPQKRLTDIDKAFALRYHAEGLTQVQIAERLSCDQATISRWLSACQDTTVEAGAYFRGKALPMAEKIVKRGRPSDLIKALQGVGVLQEERSAGLIVQIGVKDSDVQISLSPGESGGSGRRSADTLTITSGSDKPPSVNQR